MDPYNINPDQCDSVPSILITCIMVETEVVSIQMILKNFFQSLSLYISVFSQKCPPRFKIKNDDCSYNDEYYKKCVDMSNLFQGIIEMIEKRKI